MIGFSPTSLALTTAQTDNIQGSLIYAYRVRAYNIHGWGEFSDPFSIKAAQIPDQMVPVVTSIDTATGGVRIGWTMPHDGY